MKEWRANSLMVEPRSPKSLVWVRFPLCLDSEEKQSEFNRNKEFRKKRTEIRLNRKNTRGKSERRWETQKKQEKHKKEGMGDILGHHDGDSQPTIKILELCI